MTTTAPPTVTLREVALVKIVHQPGDTGEAIVSFAGIGMAVGGLPKEEFAGTLSGARHDLYFVIDKRRTWYNATAPAILSELRPRLRDHDRIYTLGNSMGGFAAVYFASRFERCESALAFVPQFSVHPEVVPGETRWADYRNAIRRFPIRHALEGAQGDARSFVMFGGKDRGDHAHLALFREHAPPGMAIYEMPETNHAIAQYLKAAQGLGRVLDTTFRPGPAPEDMDATLRELNIPFTRT